MAEKDYSSRLCAACGNEFVPATHNQRTCSKECGFIHDRNRAREYQRAKRLNAPVSQPVAKTLSVCEECSAPFLARNTRHKTCSAKCLKDRRTRLRPSRAVLAQVLANEVRQCESCSSPFIPQTYQQRYCNNGCKVSAAMKAGRLRYVGKRGDKQDRTCGECGSVFAPRDERQLTCSLLCSHKLYSRIGARTRRARMAGVHYEPVDPFKVFDRDKWQCQLCGVKTPKVKRGTHDSNAPELDHILPIAKGGSHTYLNTQCACRKCNMKKSDKPMGQMLMLG